MFKLLDITPRIHENVAFKVPELNLKNVNFLKDKFGIKYFSKNSTAYLEYDDNSRIVIPNKSIVTMNMSGYKNNIIEIFPNEEEFLKVYNVKNITIIKE